VSQQLTLSGPSRRRSRKTRHDAETLCGEERYPQNSDTRAQYRRQHLKASAAVVVIPEGIRTITTAVLGFGRASLLTVALT